MLSKLNFNPFSKLDLNPLSKNNITNIASMLVGIEIGLITSLIIRNYYNRKTTNYLDTLYTVHKNIPTRYVDVIGYEAILLKIETYINAFINGNNNNIKLPAGYIFDGETGTGKTYFAKAIAGEINIPFIEINTNVYTNIQTLFEHISKKYGKCVVFIDEAFNFLNYYSNDLLTILDGLSKNTNIFLIFAGTDLKSSLPKALFRAGRLSTTITFSNPVNKDRETFIKRKFTNLTETEIDALVKETQYMTLADINEIYNQILYDLNINIEEIKFKDIKEKINDRTIINRFGSKPTLSKELRERVINHEVGHLIISYVLKDAPKPKQITIDCSKYINPVMLFANTCNGDFEIETFNNLCSEICVLLGGSEAEKYFYGNCSTTVSSDISKINECINKILLNNMFDTWTCNQLLFSDRTEETKNKIDKIIKYCRNEAKSIIEKYKDKFEMFQSGMKDVETLEHDEIELLMGIENKDSYEVKWNGYDNIDYGKKNVNKILYARFNEKSLK